MKTPLLPHIAQLLISLLALSLLAAACGSSSDEADAGVAASVADVAETETEEATATETTDTGDQSESAVSGSNGSLSCDEVAAAFVTQGSANAELSDPEVNASCDGDTVVVTANGIPDFPYIETSPGRPRDQNLEFSIPVNPTPADAVSDIARLGPVAVAINGVPIYGPTEGAGGDVMSLGNGFTECGGHNGPTGYHYHTFDVTGTDTCRFSEADVSAAPVLFGYAFDGYPIYGNLQYESSWELTDESLFASDTFAAHSYVEGSGDLDECNGRTDDDGKYAYYTTESFPYVIGCYTGVVN